MLLPLHTDIQALSLSEPSHLSYQQSYDFTCIFCVEMWFKSHTLSPCCLCYLNLLAALLPAVCGLQVQRKKKGERYQKGNREMDRESYLMRPDPTEPQRHQGPHQSGIIQNSDLFSLLLFTILQSPLCCLTPSLTVSLPFSYHICYFHFHRCHPTPHPNPNLCSCGKLYQTASCHCSKKKSCL